MCGKKFSFKCDLYNHEKIHKGENPNKCEFCDHIARRGKHLKKHVMAMHYNQDRYKRNKDLYIRKSYKCGTCDKEFQYETQLRTHERTHIEQSYNCDLCGRKF
ncbi:PREDICTED: zinc finger protein 468-like, partial [Cyphomyrmex costatus]|uniref:zinc finger protein 468-like n=1 Tax=Cyphomyrmex costatus TaxID=456900 RepID=UPI0008523BD1